MGYVPPPAPPRKMGKTTPRAKPAQREAVIFDESSLPREWIEHRKVVESGKTPSGRKTYETVQPLSDADKQALREHWLRQQEIYDRRRPKIRPRVTTFDHRVHKRTARLEHDETVRKDIRQGIADHKAKINAARERQDSTKDERHGISVLDNAAKMLADSVVLSRPRFWSLPDLYWRVWIGGGIILLGIIAYDIITNTW